MGGFMNKDIIKMVKKSGFAEHDAMFKPAYIGKPEDFKRFAALAIQEDRDKLAKAIEAMPFGDTASSFAKFVRDFKQ